MHNLFNEAKDNYINMVDAHIRLLKLDFTKHEATREFYEEMFNDYHSIWEQLESIDEPISLKDNCNEIMKELYKEAEEYKNNIGKSLNDKLDYWSDNLLRWLYEKAQKRCVRLYSLLEKEDSYGEYKEEEEMGEKSIEITEEMDKSLVKNIFKKMI